MRRPILRMLQGAALSLGAPLGWILLSLFLDLPLQRPVSEGWWLYGYMLLGSMAVFALFGLSLGLSEERLSRLSFQDHLTGLYNTRFFHSQLAQEFAVAKRNDSPLTLVLMDLDHFKRINDTYGHQAGDEVLKTVALRVQAQLRAGDVVARVGGEEFAVILPATDLEGGRVLAERIRRAVRSDPVRTGDGLLLEVRISLGVACTRNPAIITPNNLFALVDEALYSAKNQGRDRVVAAEGCEDEDPGAPAGDQGRPEAQA